MQVLHSQVREQLILLDLKVRGFFKSRLLKGTIKSPPRHFQPTTSTTGIAIVLTF